MRKDTYTNSIVAQPTFRITRGLTFQPENQPIVNTALTKKAFNESTRYLIINNTRIKLSFPVPGVSKNRRIFNNFFTFLRHDSSGALGKVYKLNRKLKIKYFFEVRRAKTLINIGAERGLNRGTAPVTLLTEHRYFINFEKKLFKPTWTFIGTPLFNSFLFLFKKRNYGLKFYKPSLVKLDKNNKSIYKNATKIAKLKKFKNFYRIMGSIAPSKLEKFKRMNHRVLLNPVSNPKSRKWIHQYHREEQLWARPYLFLKKDRFVRPDYDSFVAISLLAVTSVLVQKRIKHKKILQKRYSPINSARLKFFKTKKRNVSFKKTRKIIKKTNHWLIKRKIISVATNLTKNECVNFYYTNRIRKKFKKIKQLFFKQARRVRKGIIIRNLQVRPLFDRVQWCGTLLRLSYRQINNITGNNRLTPQSASLSSYLKLLTNQALLNSYTIDSKLLWSTHSLSESVIPKLEKSLQSYWDVAANPKPINPTRIRKKYTSDLLLGTHAKRKHSVKSVEKKYLKKISKPVLDSKTRSVLKNKRKLRKRKLRTKKYKLKILQTTSKVRISLSAKRKLRGVRSNKILSSGSFSSPRRTRKDIGYFKTRTTGLYKNRTTSLTLPLLTNMTIPNVLFNKKYNKLRFDWSRKNYSPSFTRYLLLIKDSLARKYTRINTGLRRVNLMLTNRYVKHMKLKRSKNDYKLSQLRLKSVKLNTTSLQTSLKFYFKSFNKYNKIKQTNLNFFKTFYVKPLYFGVTSINSRNNGFFLKSRQPLLLLESLFDTFPRSCINYSFESKLCSDYDLRLKLKKVANSTSFVGWDFFKSLTKHALKRFRPDYNQLFSGVTKESTRPLFVCAVLPAFILGTYGFYYKIVWDSKKLFNSSVLRLMWRKKYIFSNASILKKNILRKLLANQNYYINNNVLRKTYVNPGFNFTTMGTASLFRKQPLSDNAENKEINFSQKLFDGALDDTKAKSDRIARIRFKPGYSTMWRKARTEFKTLFFLKFRYQHRLTNYIGKLDLTYVKASTLQARLNSNQVFILLMKSKFVTDPFWSKELLDSKSVFINGFMVSNPQTVLVKNDFLQLAIHIKYYIVLKWQKNLTIIKKTRIFKLAYKKFKSKTERLGADRNYRYPNWLLNLRFFTSDVPSFVELDFFTLSFLMIKNPFQNSHEHNFTDTYEYPLTLRLYNWKYIT